MNHPKNWQGCITVSRQLEVPPQFIAESFDIEIPEDDGKEKPNSAGTYSSIDEALINLRLASERCEVASTKLILETIIRKHLKSISHAFHISDWALKMGFKQLAKDALIKAVDLT